MPYITDHQQKLVDLQRHLNNQEQLRLQANGGNSILLSYPPHEEHLYLAKLKDIYSETATFIDVSKLLTQFIDEDSWDAFAQYYQDFSATPHKVFKSDDDSMSDLFALIVQAIKQASEKDSIPILVRTGCLFGTGIENVNIMEHSSIMNLSHPLVICYPSSFSDENILFLNFKHASTYRCTLIK